MEHDKATEPKVWFITGSSRGFGRVWTEATLQRGDKVAATARNTDRIADFKEKYGDNALILPLDVTKPDQVQHAVKAAHEHFGRLDVVINNAGYSLVGTIEEARPEDIRALYETNVLGPVSVIREVLPIMRQQGYGHILGTSSNLGHFVIPLIGYYCSSKWAFEAIHESLAAEVKAFGIHITIIEPGAGLQSLYFREQDNSIVRVIPVCARKLSSCEMTRSVPWYALTADMRISVFLISRLFVGSSRIIISGERFFMVRPHNISRILSPPLNARQGFSQSSMVNKKR